MRRLDTELIGPGIARKRRFSQGQMLEILDSATPLDIRLDEKVIGRIFAGKGRPQSKTRLQMIPISAEILGLSRASIAREIFWRETYDQLSNELKNGRTPILLDGFVLLLRELPAGDDLGSAWNHAMAPFMEADLQWDALSDAIVCLGGQTEPEVRQSCVLAFKRALHRFAHLSQKIRSGRYELAEDVTALIAARTDSMCAVAAEQLFNLALLNDEHGWHLVCDEANKPLTLQWAAALLPAKAAVIEFTATLREFLPGAGWQRRILNNQAVLTLAIASAAADGLTSDRDLKSTAHLKSAVNDAVAELLRPCDGERVPVRNLPSYRRLERAGIVKKELAPLLVPVRAAGAARRAAIAVLLATLAYVGIERAADAPTQNNPEVSSQITAQPVDPGHVLYLAGPGGTRPGRDIAAIEPRGGVTRMEV